MVALTVAGCHVRNTDGLDPDETPEGPPLAFTAVQPELFAAPGAQATAWADMDNDGDLDLFVGFRGGANRLYRNTRGTFTDVAVGLGVADTTETRAAAWGDFDADGHVDLYVGFTPASPIPNRLYRNLGNGTGFRDVAREVGLAEKGTTRQPAFIDFDNDGDLDLSVAFRDRPNALYRNDRGRFTDVAPVLGIADPRKTVGVVWFDWEEDGDLDAFVANQDGDANGFYRNDAGRFTDVADSLGVSARGRLPTEGSVGPSVADFDNDGDFDLYVANYGPDWLLRSQGKRLTDVAPAFGLAGDDHSVSSAWGDVDHDGRLDLFVVNYVSAQRDTPDHLFRNLGHRFVDVTPPAIARDNGSHGVNWVDFDQDGDLDLLLANNHPLGTHRLFRNDLAPAVAARSIQVMVLDAAGRATCAGAEVRLFRAGTRRLLGTRLVDTGGGYDSQGVMPVHFGLADEGTVDLEVTFITPRGRVVKQVPNVGSGGRAGRVVRVLADR